MSDRTNPWTLPARSLRKAHRAFRREEPDGLHDIRVALRRIGATAAAVGKEKVARRSKALVRSLSDRRQLEVDRELLARVAGAGLLSGEAAAALEARWDALFRGGEREASHVAVGKKVRRLSRKLSRLARSSQSRALPKLEGAWREARKALASPPNARSDRELHVYRLAVKRARYLAEDLAACGAAGLGARPPNVLLRAGDSLAASGMLDKPLVRRSSATPPRGQGFGGAQGPPPQDRTALPLSLRPRRARDGHYSDSLLAEEIERLRAAQTALGRWNDVRLFGKRLERTRDRAEKSGAISLSSELGRLLAALEGAISSARSEAVQSTRQFSNVVPLVGRTA